MGCRMTLEELKILLTRENWNCYFRSNTNPIILEAKGLLLELTKFLDNDVSLSRRKWHIVNDFYSIPICIECHKETNWSPSLMKYNEYCSNKS